MDIRFQMAEARQEGLTLFVIEKERTSHEAAVAKLLRLLSKPRLTSRATKQVLDLLADVSEAELVEAIRQDEEYDPLGLTSGRRVDELSIPMPHKDSDSARLFEYAETRVDQFES